MKLRRAAGTPGDLVYVYDNLIIKRSYDLYHYIAKVFILVTYLYIINKLRGV